MTFLVDTGAQHSVLTKTKVGALIHFHDMGASITGPNGTPLQVLTIRLEDEYKLLEPKASLRGQIQDWIQKFLAWAETGGMGLATG